MERRVRKRISKVDVVFNKMEVGKPIPVKGSISYWRNRQAVFHQDNPNKQIAITVENKKAFAERIL